MEQINETQQQYEPPAATPPPPPATNDVRTLYRTNGPISGVSGGLAEYFGIDAALVRLAIVAGTLVGGPIVPIGYIAAWIIIPEAPTSHVPTTAPAAPPSQSPAPVDTVVTPAPAPEPAEPAPPAPSGS